MKEFQGNYYANYTIGGNEKMTELQNGVYEITKLLAETKEKK
ncbi:hypothetical protein [Bacillus thuringiensis]|nr:hypothetical protein [Bacillus thuringiensis]